ncbi:Phenylalanyl-tRNA synthetase beta chain [Candidatus Arthromitus sp. SFB-3]|nr:Phenylalanyl-tRNA synthetase beta chain [Candidatus Arthromitus sp. SFB-3]
MNDVCDKLTISGTKVENVESNKVEVKNIVTGLIEEIKPHPDAEKLVVCSVNIGESYVQIVTGAKNMKEGDIVPVALHGAILADGTKIKKGKLRGVESQGMMCSEEELGLCDHADGLMILKDVPIGENIVNVLDSGQEIVEFEITSNRPDCLGILGIAREIKAIYGFDLKNPKFDFKYSGCKDINDLLSVDVQNKDCRRYSARVIEI